jgi:hypothetical protein
MLLSFPILPSIGKMIREVMMKMKKRNDDDNESMIIKKKEKGKEGLVNVNYLRAFQSSSGVMQLCKK